MRYPGLTPLYSALGMKRGDPPAFQLRRASPGQTWQDHQISSVSVSYGGDEPVGPIPSTMSAVVAGDTSASNPDSDLTFGFTESGKDRIQARTGIAFPLYRYIGRAGETVVNDHGRRPSQSTNMTGADWLAQVASGITQNAVPGRDPSGALTTDSLFREGYKTAGLGADLGMYGTGGWDILVRGGEPTPGISEALSDIPAKLGLPIRPTRDNVGRHEIMTCSSIRARAEQWPLFLSAPIPRELANSPAQWRQPAALATRLVTRWTQDSKPRVGFFTGVSSNGTGVLASRAVRAEQHDLTELVYDARSPQIELAYIAKARRINQLQYAVPELTFDMTMLLRSEDTYIRRLAGELLTLHVLDPVSLSVDWPPSVRGIYIITGWQEEISPEKWTINVALTRDSAVHGGAAIPHTGNTWATIAGTWDQQNTPSWNEA